ncbi:ferrous iron transport protein A [Paenibacillus sp. SYP-B3998]|uniref:Ferrous iron transport protein A n=1 Tax=Paenibacillus sp. SYP-B3998 TaxID=2678564 RepID=A0A6G3ZUS5_9BACL|nr:FeoA domain-containing protein [Paenibacillus sp. SYP-B3998]NEW05892.1 ferrous iron transport protein A [Paenibacillus sp. SYP-B3998]
MQLTDMIIDRKMRISNLASVNHLVRRRLCDLGIIEGTIICLKKKLPFEGPCTIEVSGLWIAIRRIEASRIQVEEVC